MRAGLKNGLLLGAAVAVLLLPPVGSIKGVGVSSGKVDSRVAVALASVSRASPAVFDGVTASLDVRNIANWVAYTRDNGGLAFAILDKRGARLYVFDADARLTGTSLVLPGSAPGDESVPGIGSRPLAQVRADERTTAAGRFVSEPGHDETGEKVVWVDYAAALAMHRVKVVDPKERRFERIATDSIADKRISNGCINVPIAFFDDVVDYALGRSRGIVYVLPEVKPLRQVFPAAYALAARFPADRPAP
jgi:hypothetical protein